MNWSTVIERLKRAGSRNWYPATREAMQCGCTPEDAMRIIDYGLAHKRSLSDVICRLAKARPSLPLEEGWP